MPKRRLVELNYDVHVASLIQNAGERKGRRRKRVNAVATVTGPKRRNSDAGPGVDLDAAYAGPIPGGGWE
ncbi:hypothetical protein AGMMS49928_16240 [Spirochaetia bacterium]|nr:hypothetical protein AGMMS49928_16240 [Spirochaetia bacterium]